MATKTLSSHGLAFLQNGKKGPLATNGPRYASKMTSCALNRKSFLTPFSAQVKYSDFSAGTNRDFLVGEHLLLHLQWLRV